MASINVFCVGPITLFDKSFLQGLSVDEAVWFDHFFYPVISPLFFIETLADLRKAVKAGRTSEDGVAIIALKTPQFSGGPVFFHRELARGSLLGRQVPMDGRIPIAGGRTVRQGKGFARYVEQAPEYVAFQRWQEGQFLQVEYQHAQTWRDYLAGIDLTPLRGAMRANGDKPCRDLAEVKRRAEAIVKVMHASSGRFNTALDILGVDHEDRPSIKRRWKAMGRPDFLKFAPYAAYVLAIEVFFDLAVASDLIASTRPSHRIDIGYLHYLPFCQVFVSTDRLHRLCVPLFLRPNQSFVWGNDLKADLATVNAHFASLEEDVREKGIHHFAKRLPDIDLPSARPLFEKHTRPLLAPYEEGPVDSKAHQAMMEKIDAIKAAPAVKHEVPEDAMDQLVIERWVTPRRGSWVVVPDDLTEKSQG